MNFDIASHIWRAGDDLFVSVPKPEFFFGSMMVGWLSGSTRKAAKTVAYDLGETIAVLIPQSLTERENLEPGERFAGSIRFRDFKKPKQLPQDLVDALKAKSVTFDFLSDSERRHALMYLAESENPSIRMSRIETIVEACAATKKLKGNG